MSCEPTGQWTPIPIVTTPCVKDVANFAVNEHNKKTGDDLIFKEVRAGWYKELDDDKIKHRLIIEATNGKGDVVINEAEVFVKENNGNRERTLNYFIPVRQDEEDPKIFWRKIPNVQEDSVQDLSKFAVEKNNENTNDNLKYVSTTEGWYYELNPNTTLYDLYLKAKDCLWRVRDYRAKVLEEEIHGVKILTLESFKLIPKKWY